MITFPHLNAWLQCLMQLTPPRGLVHICTGVGAGQPFPFSDMPRVLAVAADAQQHSWLQTQLKNHSQSHLLHAVVAGGQADVDYYTMSQGKESGLCPPELLQMLWPNIKLVRAARRPAVTLQNILPQAPEDVDKFNWLVVDCLPAQDLLQSAGSLAGFWDVVVVRVLKDGNAIVGAQSVGLAVVHQYLASYGLVLAAVEEENHPEIVHALFVRNPGQQLAQEKSKLIAEHAELTRASTELAAQRDNEARAKAEALAQRDAVYKERDALVKARDEQAELAADRQGAIAIQKQELASTQQRIHQLEVDNQESVARQQMMQEELIKAEAQIELIKDLLLREPGL